MSETFGPVKLSIINAGFFLFFFYRLLKSVKHCRHPIGMKSFLGLVSQSGVRYERQNITRKNVHFETFKTHHRMYGISFLTKSSSLLLFFQLFSSCVSNLTVSFFLNNNKTQKKADTGTEREQNGNQTPCLAWRWPSRTYRRSPTSGTWLPL